MTPLEDYPTALQCSTAPHPDDSADGERFQLLYEAGTPKVAAGATDAANGLRRYVYRQGKAIVFSSRFRHSTEPWVELGLNPSAALHR